MNSIQATIKNLWNGNVPLVYTFWLYYFAGVVVLRLFSSAIGPAVVVIIVAWTGFMILPIWRSSDKYKGKPLFAILAKLSAVFIALGLLGSL